MNAEDAWRPRTLAPEEAEEIAAELDEADLEQGRLETFGGFGGLCVARTRDLSDVNAAL